MRKIPPLTPGMPPDVRKHLEPVFDAIRENIANLFGRDLFRVKVSDSDERPGALGEKIVAGAGVTVTPSKSGNKEVLQISASGGSGAIVSASDDTDTTLADATETTVLTLNVTWSANDSKKLIHFGVHWTTNTASGTRADMRVRVYRGTTIIYEQISVQPSTLGVTVTNKDVGVIDDSVASSGAHSYTIRVTHTRVFGTGTSVGIVTWRNMVADER